MADPVVEPVDGPAGGVKLEPQPAAVVAVPVAENEAATAAAKDEGPEADEDGNIAVHCSLPSGLRLDVHGRDSVTLKFGMNTVNADLWAAWLAQNREYPPVKAGMLTAGDLKAPVHPAQAPYNGPTLEPQTTAASAAKGA